jgi:hypothetical protein
MSSTMQTTPQTEFNDEQNRLISSLGVKMRSVGMFILILGLVIGVQVILMSMKIYQGHLQEKPGIAEWLKWLPAAALAICALIFMAAGAWTRAAGASFLKIVTSQNRDMWHLGNAISSLYSMFSLINTLVVIGLIVMIASLALHFLSGTPKVV